MSEAWSLILLLMVALIGVVGIWWINRERSRPPSVDENYLKGLEAMVEERWKDAVKNFLETIRNDTSHIDAYLRLGEALRKLGKLQKTVQIHKDLANRNDLPQEAKNRVIKELALDWEQMGEISKAIKILEPLINDSPSPELLATYLRLLENSHQWKEAAEVYERYLNLTKEPNTTRLALYKLQEGENLCQKGDEHSGRVTFKEALKIDPSAKEAMLYIAASYIRENRNEEAWEWLNRFINEEPDKAHFALPLIEQLLFQWGRFGMIEEMLKGAIDKAPHNLALYVALIELKSKKGEYHEALDLCQRALDQFPNHQVLQLLYLQISARTGNFSAGMRHLESLVDQTLSRTLSLYCYQCGYISERLLPRCPQCGSWRSFYTDRRH